MGSSAGAVVSGDRYSNCNSDTHLTPFFGSQNDQYHPDVSCAGQRITGLFYGSDGRNPDIDSIGVFCGPSQTQGMIVGTSRGNPGNARCPEGKSVVGVYGQTMGFFNYAITICANDDGTGRAQTGEYGYNHSGQFETWYQMCRPGFVVNKLMVRTGGTVNGFNMECAQVAVGANINCEGTWITQGCNDHYPYNTERFRILQPKGGNGAECPVSDGTARQGEIYCGYVDPGGGP